MKWHIREDMLSTRDALSAAGAEAVKAACKYDAVDLEMKTGDGESIKVASIIWATGWTPYDPTKMDNLKFNESDAIITNMMMERMAAPNGPTSGTIVRPGDSKAYRFNCFCPVCWFKG